MRRVFSCRKTGYIRANRVYMRIWEHNARKYAHIREIYYKKFC